MLRDGYGALLTFQYIIPVSDRIGDLVYGRGGVLEFAVCEYHMSGSSELSIVVLEKKPENGQQSLLLLSTRLDVRRDVVLRTASSLSDPSTRDTVSDASIWYLIRSKFERRRCSSYS